MNQMMNMLLNQLKMKNPQMASQIQSMINNGGNPMELYKQITNGMSPENVSKMMTQMQSFGVPEEALKQMQK